MVPTLTLVAHHSWCQRNWKVYYNTILFVCVCLDRMICMYDIMSLVEVPQRPINGRAITIDITIKGLKLVWLNNWRINVNGNGGKTTSCFIDYHCVTYRSICRNYWSPGTPFTTLRWRHNGRDSVSNHQPHDCLLNRLFRRRSKKVQSSASLAFVLGILRWPVNSPHKRPITRKMFPFYDVIMNID